MRDEWGYGTSAELKEWGRGVDMQIFSPERRSQSFRAAKGIEESDVVVLWVSRIVPEKRPNIWLSVVKRLQDEGLPVKALVVGSGTFEKYLSKLKHVHCCGWLSGTALGEAYASSDILLFPSDVETFGNVTLEALASGCPSVVEQKCSGHLVENGVNGLTCPAGDFEAFYQATRSLVLDAHLRHQMSIAAREKAWRYERNIILQQMAENYKVSIFCMSILLIIILCLSVCRYVLITGCDCTIPRPCLLEASFIQSRRCWTQHFVCFMLQFLPHQNSRRALFEHYSWCTRYG